MADLVYLKFHDTEISKSDDFNFTAQEPLAILAALMDGAFRDVARSFVLSGLFVAQLPVPSMNVAVQPGLAFHRSENKLLHSAATLSVPVTAAHATLDRVDTLEIRFATLDFDAESRAFKSPTTGAISYSVVNTKTKAYVELRCVAGTPGAGVAPAAAAGWMKLAEVAVPSGATGIINANIANLDAQADGAENAGWTADKAATFYLGSIESIKAQSLAHEASSITSQASVHGLRQGHGNGMDSDTVDGKHASDFATAAQGVKADAAQPASTAITTSNIASQTVAYAQVAYKIRQSAPVSPAAGDIWVV